MLFVLSGKLNDLIKHRRCRLCATIKYTGTSRIVIVLCLYSQAVAGCSRLARLISPSQTLSRPALVEIGQRKIERIFSLSIITPAFSRTQLSPIGNEKPDLLHRKLPPTKMQMYALSVSRTLRLAIFYQIYTLIPTAPYTREFSNLAFKFSAESEEFRSRKIKPTD